MVADNRFITISANYINNGESWMLVCDYRWWNDYEREIQTWAKECLDGFSTEGMVVKFKSEEERNFFLMRWANG